MNMIQKKIYVPLLAIIVAGTIIRFYFTPWDLPSSASDTLVFFIEAYNYANGDFSQYNPRLLWPGFLSIFFVLFSFNEYFEYVTLMRVISILLSVSAIPLVYFVAKQFVEKNYALLASAFFAFDISIIENSTWTLTEPLFLIFALLSFYFIIQNLELDKF